MTMSQRGTAELSQPRRIEAPATSPAWGDLRINTRRPSRETVVLTVEGEVDAGTAPRLGEVLGSRLRSSLTVVVLDLSAVAFLGVAGVQTLMRGHLQAQHAGVALLIVTGGQRPVERALTACGQQRKLSTHRGPVQQLLGGDGGTPVD